MKDINGNLKEKAHVSRVRKEEDSYMLRIRKKRMKWWAGGKGDRYVETKCASLLWRHLRYQQCGLVNMTYYDSCSSRVLKFWWKFFFWSAWMFHYKIYYSYSWKHFPSNIKIINNLYLVKSYLILPPSSYPVLRRNIIRLFSTKIQKPQETVKRLENLTSGVSHLQHTASNLWASKSGNHILHHSRRSNLKNQLLVIKQLVAIVS